MDKTTITMAKTTGTILITTTQILHKDPIQAIVTLTNMEQL